MDFNEQNATEWGAINVGNRRERRERRIPIPVRIGIEVGSALLGVFVGAELHELGTLPSLIADIGTTAAAREGTIELLKTARTDPRPSRRQEILGYLGSTYMDPD